MREWEEETLNTATNTISFMDFTIHKSDELHSFIHINISDTSQFYEQLFNYFFNETRLIRYAENKFNLKFEPTQSNYVTLYKHLATYIDSHNLASLPEDIEKELFAILNDEYTLETASDGQLKVRYDKMGKIGEFIFCNILSEYFKFDCIIPKVHLTTNYNMSVYGIDTLFYSSTQDMILFGESKLSKSLSHGIGLIEKSLEDYEQQIVNEYTLILSNRILKSSMGNFIKQYGTATEVSLTISDFISHAGVKKIGVPLFIAHGEEIDANEIFAKLRKISNPKLLDLETKYILISLPIIDKSKMIAAFTHGVIEKRNEYEQQSFSQ